MENKVLVEIKNVYGRDVYYPANKEARIFAEIAETTTLTKFTIQQIKALGYQVNVVQKEVSL